MWPILLAILLFIACRQFIASLTLCSYFKEGVNAWKLFAEPHMVWPGHTFQCIESCQRVAWNCRHTGWGVKRKELTGGWRKLHHEKLMICSPSWTLLGWWNHGIWNMRNSYENLGGYPCMKLWIYRQRWEDKINMDFKEIRWKVWNVPYAGH